MSVAKKYVLILSGVGSAVFLSLLGALLYDVCGSYWTFCRGTFGIIAYPFSVLPSVFFFSLITYKMREEVFQAWWEFARWFVPVIIFVTYILEKNAGSGGMGIEGVIQQGFTTAIILAFYVIFILVSIIRIAWAYWKWKAKKSV